MTAACTLGRVDLLPGLSEQIVLQLNTLWNGSLEPFLDDLNRHIALDQDEHGPLAHQLVSTICGDNPDLWQQGEQAALAALSARLNLWNAMSAAMPGAEAASTALRLFTPRHDFEVTKKGSEMNQAVNSEGGIHPRV